jgi:hypothetical protein
MVKNHDERFAAMNFATVYPLYRAKIERKGRTEAELLQVIEWLTGFKEGDLAQLIESKANFKSFFEKAKLNPKASLIKELSVATAWKTSKIRLPKRFGIWTNWWMSLP